MERRTSRINGLGVFTTQGHAAGELVWQSPALSHGVLPFEYECLVSHLSTPDPADTFDAEVSVADSASGRGSSPDTRSTSTASSSDLIIPDSDLVADDAASTDAAEPGPPDADDGAPAPAVASIYDGMEAPVEAAHVLPPFNHSCDPTLRFVSTGKLVARRKLAAGDELTIDYAVCEAGEGSRVLPIAACRCGAAACRGTITREDYLLPDVINRYPGGYCTGVADLVSAHFASLLDGGAHPVRVSEPLVVAHKICVDWRPDIGRLLRVGTDVPSGTLLLQLHGRNQVKSLADWRAVGVVSNQVLQTAEDAFHGSVSKQDLCNLIGHSCDPASIIISLGDAKGRGGSITPEEARARFGDHMPFDDAGNGGALIVTRRDMRAGDIVEVDYETMEMDMMCYKEKLAEPDESCFKCECGAAKCRGFVMGRRYLHPDVRAQILRDNGPGWGEPEGYDPAAALAEWESKHATAAAAGAAAPVAAVASPVGDA